MPMSPKDEKKLRALRKHIERGIAALERGEYDEVSDDQLEAYLDGLGRKSKAKKTKKRR